MIITGRFFAAAAAAASAIVGRTTIKVRGRKEVERAVSEK